MNKYSNFIFDNDNQQKQFQNLNYFHSMLFSEVIGQKQLKSQLINEINKEKIGHAQLFLGRPGYGGLPLVLGFVQYLFCENKQETDSCGSCVSCNKVSKLQHPDLHFSFPTVLSDHKTSDELITEWREQIKETAYFNLNSWVKKIDIKKERKPSIGTDESQQIIKKLGLKSYEGGYKVVVMWMAQEMNPTCANKLLKILEEPPPETLFLLISSEQDYMLQTILSRTRIVSIPPVKEAEIIEYLQEKKSLEKNEAHTISSRSNGDVLIACELCILERDYEDNPALFIRLMRVCYKKSVTEMLQWTDAITETGRESQKAFLKYSLHMFRQSILRNYTEDELIKVSEEERTFLQNFSTFITGANISELMNVFNNAHYHLERNANNKILFTNLSFQVMRLLRTTTQ